MEHNKVLTEINQPEPQVGTKLVQEQELAHRGIVAIEKREVRCERGQGVPSLLHLGFIQFL
jgi:hypothetical protein